MSEQETPQTEQQRRIEELATELKNVRETTTREISELRKRVAELEDQLDGESGSTPSGQAGTFDKHDAAVLDALTGREGEMFVGKDLIDLYRQHSGIRRKRTLKRRAKDLFRSPVFEMVGSGRGRFVGSDGGE